MSKNKTLSLITFSAVLFMMGNLSNAQLSIQFLGGANFSNLHIADKEVRELTNHKAARGFFGGIGLTYALNPEFKIALEAQYSQKGYQMDLQPIQRKQLRRAHYIDFLPGIQYSPVDFLVVGGGINLGFTFDEKIKFSPETTGLPARQDDDIWQEPLSIDYDNLDIGVHGLIGVKFKDLMLFARYNLGLTNLSGITITDAQGLPIRTISEYNRNIQVGINMDFPIKNPNKVE